MHYKASPNIVRDSRSAWNNDPGTTKSSHLSTKDYLLYLRHKSQYPSPGIMDYCNEGNNPIRFYRSVLDMRGELVLDISEKQRQRMLPGWDAKRTSTIQPLPCESMIHLGKFHQYNTYQTLGLIAKVLFEGQFRKFIWDDISSQIPEQHSDHYLKCLESRELSEYMQVKKNRDAVAKNIKEAFRTYRIKKAQVTASDDPDLATYFRMLNSGAGTARMVLMAFDEIVDSFVWFGDILKEEISAGSIQHKRSGINSSNLPVHGIRRNENRSYIPVLMEFTFGNKINRVLDILNKDLAAITDSPEAEALRNHVILIVTEYADLSRSNETGQIKNKSFLKKRHKIRTKLLKLISHIKSSEILDQLERNSRSSKPGNLDHETLDRITALKEKLARHNWTHLSCIIIDVDDYTILSYKYPEHVAPRVLSMIETNMGLILSSYKPGRFTKKYKYIYDGMGRDKYIILVTLGKEAARTLAIKMCRTIAALDWAYLARGLRVTCSAGVDEWRSGSEEFRECILRASAGLDKAKITRKNSVQRGLKISPKANRLPNLKTAFFGFLIKFFL